MTFSERDVRIVQAISDGDSAAEIAKSHSMKVETAREQIEDLKTRLFASTMEEIPARFRDVTGWANDPKDYPV